MPFQKYQGPAIVVRFDTCNLNIHNIITSTLFLTKDGARAISRIWLFMLYYVLVNLHRIFFLMLPWSFFINNTFLVIIDVYDLIWYLQWYLQLFAILNSKPKCKIRGTVMVLLLRTCKVGTVCNPPFNLHPDKNLKGAL